MAIPHTKKSSVFVAIQQAALDFDSDGSEEERIAKEKKRAQKQKKNKSAKKNSNDNSLLQGLAMCSVSSKKKKGKSNVSVIEKETHKNGLKQEDVNAQASTPDVSTTPKAQSGQTSPSSFDTKQSKTVEPPSMQSPNGNSSDLGAIYTPTHIKVTRADGKVSRQIAVVEMMDQLVRFQQQNTQLLQMQDQLGKTNRHLNEQLHHNAGVVTALQNEVAMFRQMCLTLQAEVTQLRSMTPMTRSTHRPGPPPGMS